MQFIKKLFSPITATLSFIQNHFKAMIFVLILFLIFAPSSEKDLTPNNLVSINLIGPIMDVSEVLEKIEKAESDENIRGVLIVVDSPGGAVAPSIEVAYAIKRLKAKKPVVVYARGTIASGSYYASIWADEIIANPGSMVGSIGVIMQGANLSELMQKIGISTQTVKAGKYKESGTPSRKWFDYEKEELQSVINDTYQMFITDVANARKLDVKNHEKFADARIFTASQAKEVGLVDGVATISVAQETLVQLSKVENPIWKKEDKFDKFMDRLISETVSQVSMSFTSGLKAF